MFYWKNCIWTFYHCLITRAREWGLELRAPEEGQNLPSCQLSSYESLNHQIVMWGRLAKDLYHVQFWWPQVNIFKVKKNRISKIFVKFVKNADFRVFRSGRKTIIARNNWSKTFDSSWNSLSHYFPQNWPKVNGSGYRGHQRSRTLF